MQRVSAFLPSWDKRNSSASAGASSTASGGGAGLFSWPNRSSSRNSTASTGGPNGNANSSHKPARLSMASVSSNARIQREAYWPATLDEECDKAARILKSFCCDGYLANLSSDSASRPISPTDDEPKTPTKVFKKIPRRIIQNAAGIAVFTCMRSGLWMTGSGGSGILIARKSDGTWSPPSGIMLHTPTLSFVIGVDIYDCILVASDLAALEAIIRPRVTLGEDVGLASGQLAALDSEDSEFRWMDPGATVLTYLKSRGQDQHVNLAGCILTERANENERFYGSEVTQMDILAGNVGRYVEETKPLFEVIKMAEGRTDYDASIVNSISAASAPGDALIASPKSKAASSTVSFGVPDAHDPDPFGVLALEMAGLEIREAGSRMRPTSSQMNLNSAINSPTTSKFPRQSIEGFSPRSERGSYMSTNTVKSQMTDAGTQTVNLTPDTTPSPGQIEEATAEMSPDPVGRIAEVQEEENIVDYTAVDMSALQHIGSTPSFHSAVSVNVDRAKLQPTSKEDDADKASKASSVYDKGSDLGDTDDSDVVDEDFSDDEEEPVVFEVAAVQPARTQQVGSRVMQAKGSMVTIPKRLPPPLPARNPGRRSRLGENDMGGESSGLRSPLRQEFSDDDRYASQSDDDNVPKEGIVRPDVPAVSSADESPDGELATSREKQPSQELDDTPADEVATTSAPTTDSTTSEKGTEMTNGESLERKSHEEADEERTLQVKESQPDTNVEDEPLTVRSRTSTDTTESASDLKHTSSVFTGPVEGLEGRESMDRSSVTTPTSERPFSNIGETLTEETPKKLSQGDDKLDEVSVAAQVPLPTTTD